MPRILLGSAWLLGFAIFSPMFCVPPMEHILKAELLLTHTQTSLLFSAPILMIVVIAIPAGILADKIGAQKSAGIGAIIVVVGTILRSTATDASSLMAFTFIYGVGLGWSFPNLPKLVSTWVPKERAGLATAIFTVGILSGIALALAITIPVVFPITGTYQGVFLIWSIPPIIAATLWWVLIKKDITHAHTVTTPVTETRIPLRNVLRNGRLWMVAVLLMLHNFFFYTWSGWVPTLMLLKGATPSQAGLISSVTMWAGLISLAFMPRIAYRTGVRKPFLVIPSIVLGLAALGAIYVNIPLSWLLMIVVGLALITRFTTLLALPVEMMPRESVGAASGLVLAIGYAGGILGPLVGGRVLDLTGNLDQSMIILIAVSVAAAIIARWLPETGPKAGGGR